LRTDPDPKSKLLTPALVLFAASVGIFQIHRLVLCIHNASPLPYPPAYT
jgi:hypothetical protein